MLDRNVVPLHYVSNIHRYTVTVDHVPVTWKRITIASLSASPGRKYHRSSTFSGIIEKQLQKCYENPVVNFVKVVVILPELNTSELKTDQKYLYQICEAVSSGICQQNLSQQFSGKLSPARWITTECRVLRFYIGTSITSTHLKTLVEFMCKVYVPM